MPQNTDRDQVRELLRQGAQLVEVLPSKQYQKAHLPGTINLPLKNLNRDTATRLLKDKPVIVYCYDYQ